MRDVVFLRAEVNCLLADDAEFAGVVRPWFERGAELFPGLFGQLGKSGLAQGSFVDQAPGTARMSSAKYSTAGWRRRLSGLADRPAGLALSVSVELDEPSGDAQSVDISMTDEHAGTPGLVRLTIDASNGSDGAWGPGTAERWITFLADCVASQPVLYGEVGLDGNIGHTTSFDAAIGRNHLVSFRQSSEYLRGYSWITLCPAVLADRLGGAAGLRASGAFAEVRQFGSGDVLVLATLTPQEFDQAALRRVWVALAPVLPAGLPKLPIHEKHLDVVFEDVADLK
jgi:hypothetical protein